MSQRLTKHDWQIINSALALYEVEQFGDVLGWSNARSQAHRRRIEATRGKVHERLDRYANPFDDPLEHLDAIPDEVDEEEEE